MKHNQTLREELSDNYGEDLLFMDGFDDCIIGVAERCGMGFVVVYDRQKILKSLMDQGMSGGDAIEYHEFNQVGSYVGEKTPMILDKVENG